MHERKQAEERLTILVQELAHRVKNLLSVFQSITARTLTGGRTIPDAREVLIGRLQSLGHAHELLTEASWHGAELREVVMAEIAGFSERVRMSGPAVELSPSGVQTFALIVHELCTNAAKYGALSNASGEVVVNWTLGGSGTSGYMNFCLEGAWRPAREACVSRGLRPVPHHGNGKQPDGRTGHRFLPRAASPARYGYRSIPSGPAATTRPPQCSHSARSPGRLDGLSKGTA